ncbi:MAG: FliI/YscN family ATPase [Aeoliella sp.]
MQHFEDLLKRALPTDLRGSVVEITGATAAVADFPAPVGAVVEVERASGGTIAGEVIGFHDRRTVVFPYQYMAGVRRGSRVRLVRTIRQLRVGEGLLGRVIDAHGRCVDGRPQPMLSGRARLDRQPPAATERPRIDSPFATGVRSIDGLLRCGRGQRLGIFSGAGVGKSVLLGMMSRYTEADVNVIALVGERGRELNEFIERDLGPAGLAKSVIVVATSNEPALRRVQAAYTATTVAEHFRDQGKNVLLMVDSVTRFATALREIGLATGEPPATRGYPPSVFSTLPQLVERAGCSQQGSITAFYSVLVEGDDPNEPVADTMRGLLDGHLWLSRQLASAGHYPAIDVLESLSRLMPDITPPEELAAAQTVRSLLAAYREHEDLISVGAYRKGTNRTIDAAIDLKESIARMLQQSTSERCTQAETTQRLLALAADCQARIELPTPAVQTAA